MELGGTAVAVEAAGPLDGPGVAVAAVVGAVWLALGVAHHRGRFRWLADAPLVSPYTALGIGWLGAATLLALLAVVLLPEGVAPLLAVPGLLVGLLAAAAWLVGLVGIVWLPRPLRPRWLVEHLEGRRASAVAATPGPLVADDGAGTRIPVPPGWTSVDVAGARLALLGPPADDGGAPVRPSVVVTAGPAGDLDVRTLGAAGLVAALAAGAQVLAYDPWVAPDGGLGRRLELGARRGPVPVAVRRWVTRCGPTAVTVTETVAVADLDRTRPLVDEALAGLRLPGGR